MPGRDRPRRRRRRRARGASPACVRFGGKAAGIAGIWKWLGEGWIVLLLLITASVVVWTYNSCCDSRDSTSTAVLVCTGFGAPWKWLGEVYFLHNNILALPCYRHLNYFTSIFEEQPLLGERKMGCFYLSWSFSAQRSLDYINITTT